LHFSITIFKFSMNDPPLAKGDANKYMLRVIKEGNLPVISPHIFSFLPSLPNSILNSSLGVDGTPRVSPCLHAKALQRTSVALCVRG